MIRICEEHPKTVVVYEEMNCPLCFALEEIKSWEKQGSDLVQNVNDLKEKIELMQMDYDELLKRKEPRHD